MAKRKAKRKAKKKREVKEIAKPVAKHFYRVGDVKPELGLTLGSKELDVVGYSAREDTFLVAECKLTNNIVEMGKTFGQLIGYMALISKNGRVFLEKLHDKGWFSLDEIEDMLDRGKINVEFYTAFREEDIKPQEDLLGWMQQNIQIAGKGVGTIIVKNKRVVYRKRAQKIPIPISKRYRYLSEFLEDVEKRVAHISQLASRLKTWRTGRILQYYKTNSNLHFEVWFMSERPHRGEIEIGLHLETSKQRNERIYKTLKKKKKEILRKIPDIKMERWTESWYRVYERIDWAGEMHELNKELRDNIAEILANQIDVLVPILDEVNWGAKKKKIS